MGKQIFSRVGEKEVTAGIFSEFAKHLEACVESDVIIVGGGPSGLLGGKILAERGVKTVIVERNNYFGGGFWLGGYFFNKTTFRAPSQSFLDELGVPYTETAPGLFVADAPHACAALIAAACKAGAKMLSLTRFDDVVLREGNRVAGAVINWAPITKLPREIAAVDPVAIESKVVVDATGHDAFVVRALEHRGLITSSDYGAMWVEQSEDLVVERTGEAYPGLVAIGMAVSTLYGLPRMGPTFGAMLLSGQRGAEACLGILKKAGVSSKK